MRKNFLKRIASFALATTMSCAMFNANEGISSVIENMSITASAATCIARGTYSDLTWKIDSNGVLYVDTTGTKIPNFTAGSAPWYSYRSRIKKIKIPLNLQEIGNYAFYNLYNATNVVSGYENASDYCYLPTTLKRIGKGAFDYCTSLKGTNNTTLMIGVNASGLMYDLTIEETAFRYCYNLKNIWIQSSKNESVTIGKRAFSMCTSLRSLNFDVDNITLDDNAFYSCYYLETVRIDINARMNQTAFAGTDYISYSQAVGYPTGGSYDNTKGWAEKVGALVNKERKKHGLYPLKYNTTIAAASQVRAKEQLTIIGHVRPNPIDEDHKYPDSALWDVGLHYLAAENCAYNWNSPKDAVAGWMSSTQGHREMILTTKYNYTGCGFYGSTIPNFGVNGWQQFFVYDNGNLNGYVIIAR